MASSAVGTDLGPEVPDGSVFIFVDESFEPHVGAAAVVVESSEANRLEKEIAAAFDKMSSWYHLDGLPSFSEFRREGFHATSNPPEVNIGFVAFLTEVLSFKSLVVYSDGSAFPGLSGKKRLMVAFDSLVRDVLRQYASRPRIVFFFESASGMDVYVERLVERAVRQSRLKGVKVEVRFGTKRAPDLLAIPDFVLHIFNQWRPIWDGTSALDPTDHRARSLRAILGSISMARSLDTGEVVTRALQ